MQTSKMSPNRLIFCTRGFSTMENTNFDLKGNPYIELVINIKSQFRPRVISGTVNMIDLWSITSMSASVTLISETSAFVTSTFATMTYVNRCNIGARSVHQASQL